MAHTDVAVEDVVIAPTHPLTRHIPSLDKVRDDPLRCALRGLNLAPLYMGNVSTIGQAKTPSPWGAYDMGGNVVEHTDSLAPPPPGYNFVRDWRHYHGGVANAPAYQVAIYAFGYFPGNPQIGRTYPWMGFRVGVIGEVK